MRIPFLEETLQALSGDSRQGRSPTVIQSVGVRYSLAVGHPKGDFRTRLAVGLDPAASVNLMVTLAPRVRRSSGTCFRFQYNRVSSAFKRSIDDPFPCALEEGGGGSRFLPTPRGEEKACPELWEFVPDLRLCHSVNPWWG
jgi:hypothetical protein